MPRLALNIAAGAAVLLLAAACGANSQVDAETGDTAVTTETSTSTSSSPTPPPSQGHTKSASPEPVPTARDVRLIRNFVAFAVEPSAKTAAALPFASTVRLGLSRTIKATLVKSDTSEASEWVLEAKYFRAYTGPFSALKLVQRHAREAKSEAVRLSGGAFGVSVGDHPHCASPPVPAPNGMQDHRRVSVQPSERYMDSCLSWFTVDLFLDETGNIAAVTLDIWEP